MGSCEDSIGVHGPLCRDGDDDDGDAVDRRRQEQHLGLEFGKITGSEEVPCLETDAGLTGVIVEAGSGGHGFEKASSNHNAGTVDAGDVRDGEAPDRGIGLVVREGENVVGVLPGKLSDDECGFITGCLDDGWAETEECNGETTQLLVGKVETGGQVEGLVNFVDNCKSSLGVNVACGSPINCDQAYGPNDNRVGSDEGSMEEKSDGSPTRETVNCDQLVFSPHHEVCIKQISVTGSPSNCVVHNDQDSIDQRTTDLYGIKTDEHDRDICSPSSGGVMEEKADILGGNETASTDFKNSKESKNMASSLLIRAGKDKQKDDKPAGSPLEGMIMEKSNLFSRIDVLTSNETLSQLNGKADLSIQESHYDSEMPMRLSHMGDPENSSYNVNEQRDDKNVHHPSLGSMPEILDEKSDVTADTNIEICNKKLCTEENACDQKEASPETTLDSFFEKSVPPDLCQPCDATENSSSERSDALYAFGKDDVGATISGSAVNCSREMDNIGLEHAKNCCVTEMKCANIVLSSSRRRSRTSKSSRKTQTKRAGRKCGKKPRVPDMHESMEDFFKAGKRKRTCFSVPARSSVWGLFHNIAHLFKPGDGMGLDKILDHPLGKAKLGRDDGNSGKFQAGGSSPGAGGEHPVTNRRIRLKVKLGKEVGQTSLSMKAPESVDTSTSTNGLTSRNGTGSFQGTSCKISSLANNTENKLGDVETKKVLDKANLSFDASAGNLCLANSDPQRAVISEKPAGDAAEDQVPSRIEAGVLGAEIEKRYTDPGTSPDSEVINLDPECQVRAPCQEYMNGTILSSSKAFVTSGASCDKRAKKKERFPFTGSSSLEEISLGSTSINKAKATKTHVNGDENGDCFYSSEILTSSASANASSNSSSSKELSVERLPLSKETDIEVSAELIKAEINPEAKVSGGVEVGLGLLKSQSSKSKLSSAVLKGNILPGKSDIMENGRSKDLARSRRTNGRKQRGNERKSVNKKRVVEPSIHDHLVDKVKDEPESGNQAMGFTETTDTVDNVASVDSVSTDVASSGATEQDLSVDNAWVRCDDCYKWRRIPVELVGSIGQANCQWFCKDNLDKAFADCSVHQEKSNEEINAELGISDVEEDVCDVSPNTKGLECGHTMASKEYEFTHISTNQFLHRSRKTQSIDEIMVCHCVLPKDGSLGCGEECLNRMLNIECVQGTCPCSDLCSNQQFQKRSYAKMMWDRFGKKGFGLRLEDDISKGQFLIEYVGEVLDVHAYAARLKEYANKGHKHFYFMTLDNSEVIDASAKGNLGRFINHSCDPNCRTEKWVVNGEICIGIFALRDIKKGEEVTFDYNYVRVVGAAAKKCYCGSLQCRGYIGGDPTTAEVIDQVDSDEEFPEPVMLESREDGDGFKKMTSRTSISSVQMKCADRRSKDGDEIENLKPCVGKLEVSKEVEDPIKESAFSNLQIKSSSEMDESKQNLPHSCQLVEVSSQALDVTSKCTSAVQQSVSMEETVYNAPGSIQILEASQPSILGIASIATAASRKSKSPIAENKSAPAKLGSRIKTSNQSSSIKKGKMTSNALDVNKSSKPKIEGSSASRFEAVQEKLNELLDGDGGISKRKDAPKGYLKLLLLTAASGASANGEGSYGNRDLSMILDALLKTKSRAVLTDIINKNGLRMLHNMIKQCRRDFKRTPILRKLLKVLEYLAVREILTQEHINGGPPCPGMERFRDSMLSLTEHDDKTVHQIARNFRDRWIPRNFRRYGYTDREDGRMNFHRNSSNCDRVSVSHNYWHDQSVRPTEATDTVIQSKLPTDSGEAAIQKNSSAPHIDTVTKTRKRKSRWDQPAEENPVSRSLQCDGQKTVAAEMEKGVLVEKISGENSYCPQCFQNYCKQDEVISEDAPPGFSSPINAAHISPNASAAVAELPGQNAVHLKFPIGGVVGHLQAKFNSRLPVAYGIPLPIVQKYGSARAEPVESWIIAPGLPFHPFPPLPPFPNQKKETPASCAVNSMAMDETAEGKQLGSHDSPTCLPKENGPRVTGGDHLGIDVPSANSQQTLKRARGPSCDLGRRYFRQQKRNKVPPWIRNGWGFCGNNSRGGICSKDIGSETNENRNFYSSYDVSHREERAGNSFNRQPQHQN